MVSVFLIEGVIEDIVVVSVLATGEVFTHVEVINKASSFFIGVES